MEDGEVTDTHLEDARLRALYERMLGARSVGVREGCASPEAILALVRREGTEEARLATLDHVMSCSDCAREFELLRAIEDVGGSSVAAERGVVEPVATLGSAPERRGRLLPDRAPAAWRRYTPLALAASLVLALGLGIVWRESRPGNGGVMRGEAAVTLIAPATEVRSSASGVPFVWRPVPGAVRYELELLDTAGGVTFSATTRDTTITLADGRRLAPDAEYRWWVRAIDAAGAQRSSAMRRLRVRIE